MSASRRSTRSTLSQAAIEATAARHRISPETVKWMNKASKLNKTMKSLLKTASYQYGELMSRRRLSPEERETVRLYNLIEEFSDKIERFSRRMSQKFSQSRARNVAGRRSQFRSSLAPIEENPARGAGTRTSGSRRSASPK